MSSQRQVFRSIPAVVVWWLWAAFAVANLADLAVQGRGHFSAGVAAVIVAITGVVYACALRPRVIADDSGITLLNPLRDHQVPWAAVTAVDLGESLQVHCRRPGGAERVLYSWAVPSARRRRASAALRARRAGAELERQSPGYARLPPEAKDARSRTPAELAVLALTRRMTAEQGPEPGESQPPGQSQVSCTSRWAWWPIAAMVLPAIAAAAVILG